MTPTLYFSWFLKFILLSCVFYNLYVENILFAFGSLVALLLSLTPQFLLHTYKVTLPIEIDLLIALALVFHILLGELLDFHRNVYMFDKFMHFSSNIIISILAFMAVYSIHALSGVKLSPALILFFTFMTTMAIGALWEVGEFAADKMFNIKSQDGLDDTMWDFINNFAGGIVAATGIVFYIKYQEQKNGKRFKYIFLDLLFPNRKHAHTRRHH